MENVVAASRKRPLCFRTLNMLLRPRTLEQLCLIRSTRLFLQLTMLLLVPFRTDYLK